MLEVRAHVPGGDSDRIAAELESVAGVNGVVIVDDGFAGRWLGGDDHVAAWTEVIEEARASARLFVRFLVLMAVAGVIAGVGVAESNELLVIGAMAISPDLLPLAAACVGLAARRWPLATRGVATLVVGLAVASAFAFLTSELLQHVDAFSGAVGSGGLGSLTTTDASTVVIALAAGIAGMLAFETRAGTAVGVAISLTTIPAAAYLGVAAANSQGTDVAGALGVLTTNVLSVLVAGTLTVMVQRSVRLRLARER